jgi:ABC-type antimicrobial peptide transport system permease subunit
MGRQRELAIRIALGASRSRVVQQLLTESLLLALTGGGLGALLAMWLTNWLVGLSPADLPRLAETRLDGQVLGFTFAVALLTGVLFGLAPAWQASELNLNEALKEGGAKLTAGGRRARLRGALVVGELAVTFVLLVGAGLLIKSLYRLQPLLPNWNVPPMFLAVRAQSEPANLMAAVRSAVQELDRDQPVYSVTTMEQLLGRSIAPRRFNMLLLAAFAALALLLSVIGIYGLMAYMVNQRTHEIGIRVALGAQARDVLKLIIGQGLRLALGGVALGLAAALVLTRLLTGLLFEVSATDPLTFVSIAVLLVWVALTACWIPARRATQLDPLLALRCE